MSSNEQITFFDLPAVDGKCWSLNPWKTRLLLNYKGLDYKTEWVEYSDLEKRFSPHMTPYAPGSPFPYTIPTVLFADGTYVRDSAAIRQEIEKRYPDTPDVHLDSPILPRVEKTLGDLATALRPVYIYGVPAVLLNPPSKEYFVKDREARLGMSMDAIKQKAEQDDCWKEAQPGFDAMTAILKENSSGPYFMGDKVSYADFVYASFLIMMKRLGGDVWGKVLKYCGDKEATEGLLNGLSKYIKRDSR